MKSCKNQDLFYENLINTIFNKLYFYLTMLPVKLKY